MPEPAYGANHGEEESCVRAEESGGPPVRPASVPKIVLRPGDDRVVVAVSGELDLESAGHLERALRTALTTAVSGVDLDLADVAFCDCSALNVLLGMREQGLRQGKTLVLRGAGPAVERLLSLTGTDALFTDPAPDGRPAQGQAPTGPSEQDLRIEVVQLRRAMQTRPVIDLARGILMASFALSAEDAWRVLVEASQRTNTKLHHLAHDLVSAVQGPAPDDTVQAQVAAAVAKVRARTPVRSADDRADHWDD
jgi:anti-anti-sigma factor